MEVVSYFRDDEANKSNNMVLNDSLQFKLPSKSRFSLPSEVQACFDKAPSGTSNAESKTALERAHEQDSTVLNPSLSAKSILSKKLAENEALHRVSSGKSQATIGSLVNTAVQGSVDSQSLLCFQNYGSGSSHAATSGRTLSPLGFTALRLNNDASSPAPGDALPYSASLRQSGIRIQESGQPNRTDFPEASTLPGGPSIRVARDQIQVHAVHSSLNRQRMAQYEVQPIESGSNQEHASRFENILAAPVDSSKNRHSSSSQVPPGPLMRSASAMRHESVNSDRTDVHAAPLHPALARREQALLDAAQSTTQVLPDPHQIITTELITEAAPSQRNTPGTTGQLNSAALLVTRSNFVPQTRAGQKDLQDRNVLSTSCGWQQEASNAHALTVPSSGCKEEKLQESVQIPEPQPQVIMASAHTSDPATSNPSNQELQASSFPAQRLHSSSQGLLSKMGPLSAGLPRILSMRTDPPILSDPIQGDTGMVVYAAASERTRSQMFVENISHTGKAKVAAVLDPFSAAHQATAVHPSVQPTGAPDLPAAAAGTGISGTSSQKSQVASAPLMTEIQSSAAAQAGLLNAGLPLGIWRTKSGQWKGRGSLKEGSGTFAAVTGNTAGSGEDRAASALLELGMTDSDRGRLRSPLKSKEVSNLKRPMTVGGKKQVPEPSSGIQVRNSLEQKVYARATEDKTIFPPPATRTTEYVIPHEKIPRLKDVLSGTQLVPEEQQLVPSKLNSFHNMRGQQRQPSPPWSRGLITSGWMDLDPGDVMPVEPAPATSIRGRKMTEILKIEHADPSHDPISTDPAGGGAQDFNPFINPRTHRPLTRGIGAGSVFKHGLNDGSSPPRYQPLLYPYSTTYSTYQPSGMLSSGVEKDDDNKELETLSSIPSSEESTDMHIRDPKSVLVDMERDRYTVLQNQAAAALQPAKIRALKRDIVRGNAGLKLLRPACLMRGFLNPAGYGDDTALMSTTDRDNDLLPSTTDHDENDDPQLLLHLKADGKFASPLHNDRREVEEDSEMTHQPTRTNKLAGHLQRPVDGFKDSQLRIFSPDRSPLQMMDLGSPLRLLRVAPRQPQASSPGTALRAAMGLVPQDINKREVVSSPIAQHVKLLRVGRGLDYNDTASAWLPEGSSHPVTWSSSREQGKGNTKHQQAVPLFGGGLTTHSSNQAAGLTGLPLQGMQGPATAQRTEHLLDVLSSKFSSGVAPHPHGPVTIIADDHKASRIVPYPHEGIAQHKAQRAQYIPSTTSDAPGHMDIPQRHNNEALLISPIADAVGPPELRNLPSASSLPGHSALPLSALQQLTQLSALGRLAGLADLLAGPIKGSAVPDTSSWGELVETTPENLRQSVELKRCRQRQQEAEAEEEKLASTLHPMNSAAVLDFYGSWPKQSLGIDPGARQAPGVRQQQQDWARKQKPQSPALPDEVYPSLSLSPMHQIRHKELQSPHGAEPHGAEWTGLVHQIRHKELQSPHGAEPHGAEWTGLVVITDGQKVQTSVDSSQKQVLLAAAFKSSDVTQDVCPSPLGAQSSNHTDNQLQAGSGLLQTSAGSGLLQTSASLTVHGCSTDVPSKQYGMVGGSNRSATVSNGVKDPHLSEQVTNKESPNAPEPAGLQAVHRLIEGMLGFSETVVVTGGNIMNGDSVTVPRSTASWPSQQDDEGAKEKAFVVPAEARLAKEQPALQQATAQESGSLNPFVESQISVAAPSEAITNDPGLQVISGVSDDRINEEAAMRLKCEEGSGRLLEPAGGGAVDLSNSSRSKSTGLDAMNTDPGRTDVSASSAYEQPGVKQDVNLSFMQVKVQGSALSLQQQVKDGLQEAVISCVPGPSFNVQPALTTQAATVKLPDSSVHSSSTSNPTASDAPLVLPAPSSGPSPNLAITQMLHSAKTTETAVKLVQQLFPQTQPGLLGPSNRSQQSELLSNQAPDTEHLEHSSVKLVPPAAQQDVDVLIPPERSQTEAGILTPPSASSAVLAQDIADARPTEQRSGPGPTEQRSGPGTTEQHSGPGATEQHSGPGATEQRSGPGTTEQHSGPGATEQRSGPGATEQRSGPGTILQHSGPGPTEQRSGPGATEQRSGPGTTEQHSGPGATEQHSGPGATEQRSGPGTGSSSLLAAQRTQNPETSTLEDIAAGLTQVEAPATDFLSAESSLSSLGVLNLRADSESSNQSGTEEEIVQHDTIDSSAAKGASDLLSKEAVTRLLFTPTTITESERHALGFSSDTLPSGGIPGKEPQREQPGKKVPSETTVLKVVEHVLGSSTMGSQSESQPAPQLLNVQSADASRPLPTVLTGIMQGLPSAGSHPTSALQIFCTNLTLSSASGMLHIAPGSDKASRQVNVSQTFLAAEPAAKGTTGPAQFPSTAESRPVEEQCSDPDEALATEQCSDPDEALATELSRLILKAFKDSGGVIAADEKEAVQRVNTKQRSQRGVAAPAAGQYMQPPTAPASVTFLTDLRTATSTTDMYHSTIRVQRDGLRLPSVLPNPGVPRGTGPAFLQVLNIEQSGEGVQAPSRLDTSARQQEQKLPTIPCPSVQLPVGTVTTNCQAVLTIPIDKLALEADMQAQMMASMRSDQLTYNRASPAAPHLYASGVSYQHITKDGSHPQGMPSITQHAYQSRPPPELMPGAVGYAGLAKLEEVGRLRRQQLRQEEVQQSEQQQQQQYADNGSIGSGTGLVTSTKPEDQLARFIAARLPPTTRPHARENLAKVDPSIAEAEVRRMWSLPTRREVRQIISETRETGGVSKAFTDALVGSSSRVGTTDTHRDVEAAEKAGSVAEEARDLRRSQMIGAWMDEMHGISSAVARMETAQAAGRMLREQAEKGRREREEAEVEDLLQKLEELDEMAKDVEEETSETRAAMQAIEAEQELRHELHLKALYLEARRLGAQVEDELTIHSS